MTKWYYSDNHQAIGPISEEEFSNLVITGKITEETLVWREGLADWQPYRDIKSSHITTIIPEVIELTEMVSCSECHQLHPKEDMMMFQDRWICTVCKPVFVQKLKEGVELPGEMVYARFGIRTIAKIIDGFILLLLYSVLSYFGTLFPAENTGIDAIITLKMIVLVIHAIFDTVYSTWFVGKYAATPGKMICKIKIVFADGRKVGYGWAFARHFAELISSLILGFGYLMAAFDEQKRTLHDLICGTRVIRK